MLRHHRDERGLVLPSAVVWFSIAVLAVAAIAFFVTRDDQPEERDITDRTAQSPGPGEESSDSGEGGEDATDEPSDQPTKKPKPPIVKADVGVNVFNNTTTAGLAAEVLAQVDEIGWNGLVADNWYGTVDATTVYYPVGMKREARQLALDLGIASVKPAVVDTDMSDENLTLILTGPLG